MKKLDKELLRKNVLSNIERDIEYCTISAAAVIVAQDGEIILDERLGYKDPIAKVPLCKNTLFRLASMTKPVTAVAALIGVDEGWFSLDDKISDYYPKIADMYVGREENGAVVADHKPKKELLLRDFLTHTSGFMGASPIQKYEINKIPQEAYKDNKTAVDFCIKNTCLTYEPKLQQGYCGQMAFDVVALLIEKYSGMKFADFIDDKIFKPLGIKDFTYRPTEEQWSRLITMTDKMGGRGHATVEMGRHTFENYPLEYTCAGAGLVSSIEDYFIFAEMLRRGGEYNGTRIISSDTLKLMSKPYVSKEVMGDSASHSWGLGVRVTSGDKNLPDGCFGWCGAYGTHFWVDPENDITAIYMKNSRWYDSTGCGETGIQFEKAVMDSLK